MIHGKYIEVLPVIESYLPKGIHFYYICAGRGLGKTYSALHLCKQIGYGEHYLRPGDEGTKFMFLRRTGVEAKAVASPEACPFKTYNRMEGFDITADFSTSLGFGNFYKTYECKPEDHIGYVAALSTFANLRGADFVDVSFILYDECLPESRNKHKLKDEGYLLLNMLETINRNRALEGRPELIFCMLSNPIDLGSPFLSQLSITPILNNMILRGQQKYTDYNRSLHIEKITDHKVAKEKEASFLYKFAKPTGFNEQALSGDFTGADMTMIVPKVNLTEYKAFLTIENITVYKHKSNDTWYVSEIQNSGKYNFKVSEADRVKEVFYWKYKLLVLDRLIYYSSYQVKVILESMINYKPYVPL